MTKIDLKNIDTFYSQALKTHGNTATGVGWRNSEGQHIRLNQLLRIIDNPTETISVNDLGCGYGALYTLLQTKNIPIKKYYGYDISSDMIEVAKQSLPNEDTHLEISSGLNQVADYSFASGIFNICLSHDKKLWHKYIEKTLFNLHEHSSKGFAFNLLSTYADFQEEELYYGDPMLFFDFCKQNFSKNVTLLHDYDLFDWTMIVRK